MNPSSVTAIPGKYLTVVLDHEAYGVPVKKVREIIRLEKQLSRDSTNSTLVDAIAHVYEHMGNKDAALKYSAMAHH